MDTSTAPPGNETSDQIGPPAELAPIIAKYHFFNDLIAGVLSIMINLLLIFVVTKRISSATKVFKKVMGLTKSFEILFSVSYIITAPVFTSISIPPDFTGLMIVNTGWQFNVKCSLVFLCLAMLLLTQQIFLSPLLYYFRYAQVCRKTGVTCIDVFLISFLNCLLHVFTSVCLCFASMPTIMDAFKLSDVAKRFTGIKSVFLLLSYTFFCPLIFIQVPFYYSVLGPIVGLSQGLATDLLPLLFAWSPVINTLIIFILNSEIRNALIGKQRMTATSDARRSFANEN
uniref:G_PROTEIN_RECEP_F1_2 domain-containing protein n=1 Tax=Caenorhabditis tropicalis TaxID=1561998 RepID=A0A1I7UVZ7_9PELO